MRDHNLYHVFLSLKRGTVSARNITLLIDYCVNYYCGLLFNIKRFVLFLKAVIVRTTKGAQTLRAVLREAGRLAGR